MVPDWPKVEAQGCCAVVKQSVGPGEAMSEHLELTNDTTIECLATSTELTKVIFGQNACTVLCKCMPVLADIKADLYLCRLHGMTGKSGVAWLAA